MSRYRVPKNAGTFRVDTSIAGSYIVLNDKTGGGKISIPCRDLERAEWLCNKLNEKDHDGEIWV
jgi:hypothetical protein